MDRHWGKVEVGREGSYYVHTASSKSESQKKENMGMNGERRRNMKKYERDEERSVGNKQLRTET